MKTYFLTLSAALTLALASTSSAQTALFTYNDGVGAPNAGSYLAGQSFTFALNLTFAPGGTVDNLEGLSYWMQQVSPAGSPFNFAITLRDITGSMFTDLQTPSLTYPQNLNPSNANDLGGARASMTGVGANTYFVANITVSIDPSAALGTYTIGNTTSGGKTSVIADDGGDTFAIPQALYTITVVPEPGTWVGAALVAATLLFSQRRRLSLALARK